MNIQNEKHVHVYVKQNRMKKMLAIIVCDGENVQVLIAM